MTSSPGNRFEEPGECTIQIPALPRPTTNELQGRSLDISAIERDTSPTSPVNLVLATAFRKGERGISAAEYERRLVSHQDVLLGFQHCVWLFEHQDEFLSRLAFRVFCIDFPGLLVACSLGYRLSPVIYQVGDRWMYDWHSVDNGFSANRSLAIARA